ncbi:MAG: glutathione peroxidase [Bacteroidia bacterium]
MNPNAKSFYDFKLKSIDGKEIDFSVYKGKKVLIVNTASECGYTPQYDELQHLHETHSDKLIILGFPANNFGGQEPGSNDEIGSFCRKNFGVTFQLFQKSEVIGNDQNPLYKWLTDKDQNGWNTEAPTWNFCKYLVSENGELLKFYSAAISPMSEEIVEML